MRLSYFVFASFITITFSQAVQAQPYVNSNPALGSPYSRTNLSPYLNLVGGPVRDYFFGTQNTRDIFAQMVRPIVVVSPDVLPGYDPSRSPYSAVTGYQSAEEWVNQRIRETQLSSTGHPAGFLMATPFYRMPNQRSFNPYNIGTNNPAPGTTTPIR